MYANLSPNQVSGNSSNMGGAGGSWVQTEHPNPGMSNDALAFQFFVDGLPVESNQSVISCYGTLITTITVDVYNYQPVESVAVNSGESRIPFGSFIN